MEIRFFSESFLPNGWENPITQWARIYNTEEDFEEEDSNYDNILKKIKKNETKFNLFENDYANYLTNVACECINELAKDKKIIAILNCSNEIFCKTLLKSELDIYAIKTSEHRMLYYAYYKNTIMIVYYAFSIAE